MGQAIIVLTLVGFLLLAAEVFVPGLVLGSLGALCLLASVALCYAAYGPLLGTVAFAVLAAICTAGFLIWLRVFPHTPIGRKMMLHKALQPDNSVQATDLLGAKGEAVTPLRPAGTALINGRRVDVVTEGTLIEPGQSVQVVLQEGLRVVVRALD